MPSFAASGYGPYSSFVPAASDAYSALLSRMPTYAEEKFQRAKRRDDMDVQDRNDQRKERKKRLAMEEGAVRDAKREREAGKAAASQAEYKDRQEGLRDQLAASSNAQRRAARYGGDPFSAGQIAANEQRLRRR